jgi:hypothetical protein
VAYKVADAAIAMGGLFTPSRLLHPVPIIPNSRDLRNNFLARHICGAGRAAARAAPLVGRGPDPTVKVDDLWLTLTQQASLIYQAVKTRTLRPGPLPTARRVSPGRGNVPMTTAQKLLGGLTTAVAGD